MPSHINTSPTVNGTHRPGIAAGTVVAHQTATSTPAATPMTTATMLPRSSRAPPRFALLLSRMLISESAKPIEVESTRMRAVRSRRGQRRHTPSVATHTEPTVSSCGAVAWYHSDTTHVWQ